MSELADLTVAISTLGAGIDRIQLPEPVVGIRYLVLHQRPQQVPSVLLRADVRVVALDTLGLSNSRNAALEQAKPIFWSLQMMTRSFFPMGCRPWHKALRLHLIWHWPWGGAPSDFLRTRGAQS